MAKELPFFKFEPAEYLTGDISFCSLAAQGLFTILCSYYWQRSCNLTKDQFLKRINNPKEFNELVDENVIKVIENNIKINFLDIQFKEATNQSKTNSINGSKGGRPKKQNRNKTEIKPKQNPIESETKGIREDKIRKEEIILDNIKTSVFISTDSAYDFLKKEHPTTMESFEMQNKKSFVNYDVFIQNFESKIIEEGIPFESDKLYARLTRLLANWNFKPKNEQSNQNQPVQRIEKRNYF